MARAIQGLGGAVVSAVALSLIMTLFAEPAERAKAMGVFGFVAAGGGSIGVLLGGVLTNALNWHWVFLVKLPVGVAVVALSLVLLPPGRGPATVARLDIAGAVTVTASLMLAVYAIVNGNQAGWTSGQTIGLLAAVGLALFARAPVGGNFATDVLPGMTLLGLGAGMAFNPVLLAALSDVAPQDSGLASGVVNTSFMMGGALGLAILASLATARTNSLVGSGLDHLAALNGGYHVAFLVAALFAACASALGAALLRFTASSQDESRNEQRAPEVPT
jgi:MFS family permease